MAIAYTRTATSLTIVVGFRPKVIPSSHPNFAKLVDLAKLPDTTEADVIPLLDIPTAITNFTGGEITIVGGKLFYRGSEVKSSLAKIILDFVKSGDEAAAEPFRRFLANCRQNPDLALVDTIYDWAVKGNLPITPAGELIAWKIVGKDYMSIHTGKRGKLRHRIGDVVTEPREECDPNRNQTCSTGIHFCSIDYLQKGGYGGGLDGGNRVMAVVINPADVTAIPADYNLTKGRCCKLTVVGEVEGLSAPTYYGDAKVHDWSPAPRRTRFPLQAGDVWRTDSGKLVTITRIDGEYAYGDGTLPDRGLWWANDGTCSRNPRHRWNSEQVANQLVELVSEGQVKPRTPRNAHGYATGQVWADRAGNERKIERTNAGGTYPVRAEGMSYTVRGSFNSDTTTSQFDLVRLVKDVD